MKAIKKVRFGDVPVGMTFVRYSFNYEKITEDHVLNLDTKIITKWRRDSIMDVEVDIENPQS